jgi:hypothetical protein
MHLVDMELVKIVPTWMNTRRGPIGISKRLDRFFIVDSFLNGNIKIKSCMKRGGMSDHLPIIQNLDPMD